MIKLFTHTDLDGVGCAVLAKLAFADDVNIEYCNYNEINEKVREYAHNNKNLNEECHITDISINDDLAYEIAEDYNGYIDFYLLDHHPTALELNKYNWCNVQIENDLTHIKTSGTEMYYNWLVYRKFLKRHKRLDRFVEIVRDYDTWRWSELGDEGLLCKQVNDLLYLYGREKFISWCVSKICSSDAFKLDDTDKLLLDIKQKEIDAYVEEKDKQLFASSICGRVCGFVFAEKYFSELGNRLCMLHPEIDFIAMININGTVSYRTIKEDIDLGKDVAKLFGGGGHSKAAGSQFSKEVLLKVIELIFSK
ncbi:MAG: hypothetical protein K1W16_13915 [Lachnospiraceae bacterium]